MLQLSVAIGLGYLSFTLDQEADLSPLRIPASGFREPRDPKEPSEVLPERRVPTLRLHPELLVRDETLLGPDLQLTPLAILLFGFSDEETEVVQQALFGSFEDVKALELSNVQYVNRDEEPYYELPVDPESYVEIVEGFTQNLSAYLGYERAEIFGESIGTTTWFSGHFTTRVSVAMRRGYLTMYESKRFRDDQVSSSYTSVDESRFAGYFRLRYGHLFDIDAAIEALEQKVDPQ